MRSNQDLVTNTSSIISLTQILYDTFFDPNSSKDIASMVYNMNLVRNSNARRNVLERLCEFLN